MNGPDSPLDASGVPGPWSAEVEEAVLGGMLLEEEARRDALARLETEDFHREANRRIFTAFARLNGRGQTGDVTILADELRASDDLEAAGGMKALSRLVDAVPSADNVADHAERLRELRLLRDLHGLSEGTLDAVESVGPGEAATVVANVAERLREIETEAALGRDDLLRTALEILEDPDTEERVVVVADCLFWRGIVSLLAGREKSGKSTLIRWAASRVSRGLRVWEDAPNPERGVNVLYWAEERPVDVAADLDRLGADLERIYVRDMRLAPGDRFATLRADLERVGPALVVIDTLATFVARMELDPGSSSDWNPVMNRFGALAQEHYAAVGLSHHARKADGEYRDSTAIGGGVDAILKMGRDPDEGEAVRKVTARARSVVPARPFTYELIGEEEGKSRLALLDGSLSLEERVQRFVRRHEGCGQRDVINGVRGRGTDVRTTLKKLCEGGGPLVEDDSTTPYEYRIRQNPVGNGTETPRKRSGNRSTGNGGGSVSEDAPPSYRGGRPETPAEPVDDDPPDSAGAGETAEPEADDEPGGILRRAEDALDLRPVEPGSSFPADRPGDEAPLFTIEERIERFVLFHDGCTRKEVVRGVDGPDAEIEEALDELARDGIPVTRDDSKTPPEYLLREKAKRCACGNKIGPSASVCVRCKREQVGEAG